MQKLKAEVELGIPWMKNRLNCCLIVLFCHFLITVLQYGWFAVKLSLTKIGKTFSKEHTYFVKNVFTKKKICGL